MMTALLLGALSPMLAVPAYATQHLPLDKICQDTPEATVCKENTPQTVDNNNLYGPNGILTKVIRILSVIVGIVSIFVIIISGIKFMSSGGDSSKVGNARESLTYAVIGLIVVAFSQAIVIFVINKL